MLAFMQRVINGGGHIHREYALGAKRVDLLIRWKKQTVVIELKIKHSEDALAKGLEQIAHYMELSGASEGHLILFDRSSTKSWEKKISHESIAYAGKKIQIWTM